MGVERTVTKGRITGVLNLPSGTSVEFTCTKVELNRELTRETHSSWNYSPPMLLSEKFLLSDVVFERPYQVACHLETVEPETGRPKPVYLPECKCRATPHEEIDPDAVKIPKDILKKFFKLKKIIAKKIVHAKLCPKPVVKLKGRKLSIKGRV